MLHATNQTRVLRRHDVKVSTSLLERAYGLYHPPSPSGEPCAPAPAGYYYKPSDGGPWCPRAEVAVGYCGGIDARNGPATDPIVNKPWPPQEHPVDSSAWLGVAAVPIPYGDFPAHGDVLDVRVEVPSRDVWREVILIDDEDVAAAEAKVSGELPFFSQS
jgi:hypothetical protein